MTAEKELNFEFIKTALTDNDPQTSEVAMVTLSEIKEEYIEFEEEIKYLKGKVEDLEDDIESEQEDCNDLQSQKNSLSDELTEVQEKLDDLDDAGMFPKTLYDEMKAKVLGRLNKNLSLEQLENLEGTVKTSFKSSKKNYVEDF